MPAQPADEPMTQEKWEIVGSVIAKVLMLRGCLVFGNSRDARVAAHSDAAHVSKQCWKTRTMGGLRAAMVAFLRESADMIERVDKGGKPTC